MSDERQIWRPNTWQWLVEGLMVVAFFGLAGRLPDPYGSLVMVGGMLYAPILLGKRIGAGFMPSDAVALRRWVVLSALFLLGFVAVVVTYALQNGNSWQTPDLTSSSTYLLTTLLGAAIPEELFFRGFLLPRWQAMQLTAKANNQTWWWPTRTNLQISLVFGLVHVASGLSFRRMDVFFPSLWYGAMVEQRGGIAASITAHTLSNFTMYVVFKGFGWL